MGKQFFKLFIFTCLFIAGVFFLPQKSTHAYPQDSETCYAQCAAYKFVWQGDFCWDTFQNECVSDTGTSIKDTIKFLKSIYGVVKSGKEVETVFKAWFMCKPLIEECIAPQLRTCRSACEEDQLFYAPDISVGNPYGNFYYHGVVYNERDRTLTFKVVNNGKGYAWDIGANATWGHTRNRDGQVSGGGQLFDETIPELIYFGARNGPMKTVGDYIKDFLIEETNFAKYLQGFKSDADDYNVPVYWYKTVPFTPIEGEMTKVFFNVDSNQMIPERNEINNTFILEIDKLPTPPAYQIENFSHRLENNTLNNFLIDFNIRNTGEESGQASVKIYEGKYTGPNQTAVYNASQVVQGLNHVNFNTFLTPDLAKEATYCGNSKRYTLVVFDDTGRVDSHEFSLPLYSGFISGSIEDLFGKNVEGATVTTNTGQISVTNKYGSYHLKNISQLGKITVTVTHPEYSRDESQDITLQIKDINDPCAEGSLSFYNVNFVLKDLDVLFTINIKDKAGNPVTAQVLAGNENWRFDETIQGTGPLPGMQPGQYTFTISAPGYKTISQTVNAVPNEQNLNFTLEKLFGRPTDGGLTIHEPQLLWEIDRGEEILANMAASKDGNLVVLYTTKNKTDSGKLYFLDALTGNHRKILTTIATAGQSQASLDTSYDGNTTALFVHFGIFGTSKNARNVLKLFNNQGNSIGETELNSMKSTSLCEVSPDGFYVYPYQLLNKGLYQYTRYDIEGVKNSKAPQTYTAAQGFHFTTANNKVSGCSKGGGYCVEDLKENVVANLGDIKGPSDRTDSSQDGGKIGLITNNKVYFWSQGERLWEKDIKVYGDTVDVSVSPGGKYVIYSTANEQTPYRFIKIFTDNNLDKTPDVTTDPSKEDVVFVHANDKGIFFATRMNKKIRYYKVGSYSTDYNPQEETQNDNATESTNQFSYYENGTWLPVGQTNFYNLTPGRIYSANDEINFRLMDPNGKLYIQKDTLFSVDQYIHPVLLKGQMTAEFASPATVYAIKFDRFDLNLFQTKLDQFIQGSLSQSEYFVVKNVHTRFVVTNDVNEIKIAVETGQVQVIGEKIDKTIDPGKQISIDEKNNIKSFIYLGKKIYVIIMALAIFICGLLYRFRNNKVIAKILDLLTKLISYFFKFIKYIFNRLLRRIKKNRDTPK
ncbi:hypothetical protein A2V49_01875 [candidate division WWE3 bacterium RBG_19FT_COMBO_34_6]|uniref:Cadherin domain-containing protein n=1 Tax=candidate division WWE3 bacterium RBG_19FT_COMBO_34_6 TaxID=1802612 RepID=A0A1F4UL05_UNCKA|nr:MAG: hypothetical protein A2V49_01875 [candidate division WWE3 bacterium RBG_19FT_COMBO_34_6]